MNRNEMLSRITDRDTPFDVLVIGGGATGVGIAVDAAARGHATVLLEQSDFGKGTSSRSTKLVHGGVRYLQQGNISLVMEALKERGILRQNAPHLVSDLRFIVPNYDWWEAPFYGVGLKVYDMLAGKYGFGPSRLLSSKSTLDAIPTLRTDGLKGGVQYYDGQFDDARLLIHLVLTAADQCATLCNYMPVTRLLRDDAGYTKGVVAHDLEAGGEYEIHARVVINATGPFTDGVRRLDDANASPMIAPSQGVHIVLDQSFLPGDSAIMVPHTRDGRVMFAIPWHGVAVVGTTDTPIETSTLEPTPLPEEIDFILETAGRYLDHPPTRADVRSVFAGIRPLVKAGGGSNTAALSRDHTIDISPTGLVTICGGKWTTYRKMAEDAVDHAATIGQLDERPCVTRQLNIHGYHQHPDPGHMKVYGSDAADIRKLIEADPALAEKLDNDLPYTKAEVIWSARNEMARTVDDVLSRRTRALLLNAKAAIEAAGVVAGILADELGYDESWQTDQVDSFREIAAMYVLA